MTQLLKPECRVRNMSAKGLALSCAKVVQEGHRCNPAYTNKGKQYPAAMERVKTAILKGICFPNPSCLAWAQVATALHSDVDPHS